MNHLTPFEILSARAAAGELSPKVPPATAAYLASEAFRQRTDFVRQDTTGDQLKVLHFLLSRLALHPAEEARMLQGLDGGIVRLDFFGVPNPVPVLFLVPTDPELPSLKDAVLRNLASDRTDAARRLLTWRTQQRQYRRFLQEESAQRIKRKSLAWPTATEIHEDPEQARQRDHALFAELDAHRVVVRTRRDARLARLYRVAVPSEAEFFAMLEDVAVHLLTTPDCSQVH